MGLLDSGFGLMFRFDVSGLSDMRAANAVVEEQIRKQRNLNLEARKSGTLNRQMRADLAAYREQHALNNDKIRETEARHMFAAKSAMFMGGALAGAGAAGLFASKSFADEAIRFEAALQGLGIRANVFGKDLKAIGEELKSLATEMGMSAESTVAAGEVFAKAGAQINQIKDLTREALVLANAENMGVENAANTLMQTTQVFKESLGSDRIMAVRRFTSALITMSNATTANAEELMDISRRAGGAAANLGLTADQMLAIAAAVRDFGVTSEVAGTALSNLLTNIEARGPKAAKALGVPVDMLNRLQGIDKIRLIMERLTALRKTGNIDAFNEAIKQLVGSGARGRMALNSVQKSAAQMTDQIIESGKPISRLDELIRMSSDAFNDGSLAQKQMTQRAEVLGFQMKRLGSMWNVLKISFGEALTPAIKFFVDFGQKVLTFFNELPEPMKHMIALTLAFGSVASVALGGTLLLAGSLSFAFLNINRALAEMGVSSTALQIVRMRMRKLTVETALFQRVQKGVLGGFLVNLRNVTGFLGRSVMGALRAVQAAAMFVIVPFVAWLSKFPALIGAARILLGLFTGPVGWAFLVGGAIAMIISWDKITAKITEATRAVRILWDVFTTGETTLEGLNLLRALGLEELGVTLGMIGYEIRAFWKGLTTGFDEVDDKFGVIETFADVFMFAMSEIGEALSPVWEMLKHVFGIDDTIGTKEGIGKAQTFGSALAWALGLAAKGFAMLMTVAVPVIKFLATGFSVAINSALLPLRVFWNTLQGVWNILKSVSLAIGTIFDPSMTTEGKTAKLKKLWEDFKASMLGDIGDLASAVGDVVLAVLGVFGDTARNWANGLIDTIKGWWGGATAPVPPAPGTPEFEGPPAPGAPVPTPPAVPKPPVSAGAPAAAPAPKKGRSGAAIMAEQKSFTVNNYNRLKVDVDGKTLGAANSNHQSRQRSRGGASPAPRQGASIAQ